MAKKSKEKELKIHLVKHPSAKRVVISYYRFDHPIMTDERILQIDSGFMVCLNEKDGFVDAAVSDLLKVVRRAGLWGFCNHKNETEKEIHYWIGKRALNEEVLELFAHELTHAAGYQSEKTACIFAGIARYAYNILQEEILGVKMEVKKGAKRFEIIKSQKE